MGEMENTPKMYVFITTTRLFIASIRERRQTIVEWRYVYAI